MTGLFVSWGSYEEWCVNVRRHDSVVPLSTHMQEVPSLSPGLVREECKDHYTQVTNEHIPGGIQSGFKTHGHRLVIRCPKQRYQWPDKKMESHRPETSKILLRFLTYVEVDFPVPISCTVGLRDTQDAIIRLSAGTTALECGCFTLQYNESMTHGTTSTHLDAIPILIN